MHIHDNTRDTALEMIPRERARRRGEGCVCVGGEGRGGGGVADKGLKQIWLFEIVVHCEWVRGCGVVEGCCQSFALANASAF